MSNTIRNAQIHVKDVMAAQGDGWLSADEDPFKYDDYLGARIFAKSVVGQHLTWGILGATLKGLQDCVIRNGWYQDVTFQVFDGGWGHVGSGSVLGGGR